MSDGAVTLTDASGTEKTYSDAWLEDDDTTIAVVNHPGAALPNAGGAGTHLFVLTGMLLITAAGALLLAGRRTR